MTMPQQRPGQSKQDYATPEKLIVAVKGLLNVVDFRFDFAADASNAKAERFWTEQDDSLSKTGAEWAAQTRPGWGWLNPPFEDIGPWARRCVQCKQAGGQVALLVPASVGSNWYRDYVDGRAHMLALNGRVPFMPDKPKWLYPKDCILCLYSLTVSVGPLSVWTWESPAPSRSRRRVSRSEHDSSQPT